MPAAAVDWAACAATSPTELPGSPLSSPDPPAPSRELWLSFEPAPGTFEDVPKLLSDRIDVLDAPPTAFVPTPDELPPGSPCDPRVPSLGAASFRPPSAGISYTTPEGLSASGSLGRL